MTGPPRAAGDAPPPPPPEPPLDTIDALLALWRVARDASRSAGDVMPAEIPDADDPQSAAFYARLADLALAAQDGPARRATAARAAAWAARTVTADARGVRQLRVLREAPSLAARGGDVAVGEACARRRREPWAPALDFGVAAGVGLELWDAPCADWVRLPDGTPPGRYVAVRVRGDSMAPLLRSGDTLLVDLDGRAVRDAMVVARVPDDGYVVKRVARVGRERLELAPLDPAYPSITLPRDASLLLGRVVVAWCPPRAAR